MNVRVTLSVGVRQYEADLCIAQALQPPFLSAADATPELALEKLAIALTRFLEHAHPSQLSRYMRHADWEPDQRLLPLYPLQESSWHGLLIDSEPFDELLDDAPAESDASSSFGLAQIDVAAASLTPDLHALAAPTFGVVAHARTPELAERALITTLRAYNETAFFHRPPSALFNIVELPLSITPLDLMRVPQGELWRDQFSPALFQQKADADRPATPTLEAVAELWSHLSQSEVEARGFEPCFAREARLQEIRDLVDGKLPTPVVLVGPPRVGKTALVKHMAWNRRAQAQRLPDTPKRRLWFASAPRLCATDAMSSGWQLQCQQLFSELESSDEILYLGRLIESLDAGKFIGSDYNLAQFVKPLLADRRVRLIAEATPAEWNVIEQRDIGFARTFHVIRVEDLPDDVSLSEIVVPAAHRIAHHEQIVITPQATRRAWLLQQRFAAEGSAVGRTLDFLSSVARRAVSSYRAEVDELDLVAAFCEATGLPQFLLLDDRTLDLEKVVAQLEQRVMGQHHAVRRVADVIGITKAGLAPPDRPLSSFLFVGPTGVGKTELARALAQFLFGDEDRLVRLDMSEYSHPDAYGRLIGEGAMARTLEMDYTPGGDLTGPVRRQPFCVILLDEIEKAHSSVFDLLLQVLGEARLTDVHGRTTRFQNTIVIMTSNLGVESLRPSIGFAGGDEKVQWERHFRKEAERFFRPEFLARIDQIIPFHALSPEVITHIADRELSHLVQREGLARLDVSFSYTPEVAAWVARKGWDPQYGARPLKRLIEREIAAPLAERLASTQAELEPRQMRRITLDLDGDRLDFQLQILEAQASEFASRHALLAQIEEIARLRRKLQHYTYTEVYSDLEWEIESFSLSSMGEQFWQLPNAAEIAARADRARRIVHPAEAIAQELGALEDLAHEAYYGRSFELREDLEERLQEIRPQVREIFLVILRSVFESPDEATLFLPLRRASGEAWRNQLVRWYVTLAQRLGLSLTAYRSLPEHQLARLDPELLTERPMQAYERLSLTEPRAFASSAAVIVLQFQGFAARPHLLAEDGIQRLVEEDASAQVEIWLGDEGEPWPLPEVVAQGRPSPTTSRVWNRRTQEVSIPYYASVPLEEHDPWRELLPLMEDVAWMIVESRWEN